MKPDSTAGAILGVVFRSVFAIVAVYLIYYGTSTCYDYGYRIFAEPAISAGEGKTVTVKITKGMSPWDMGKMMVEKGLSRDDKLFALQYYCSEYRKDIKAGTYDLSTAMKAEEMFQVMATDPQDLKDSSEENHEEQEQDLDEETMYQ